MLMVKTLPLSHRFYHVGQVTLLQGQNPQPWRSRMRYGGAWSGGWAHSSSTAPVQPFLCQESLCAWLSMSLTCTKVNSQHQDFSRSRPGRVNIILCQGSLLSSLVCPTTVGVGRRKKKPVEFNKAALRETGFDIPGMTLSSPPNPCL